MAQTVPDCQSQFEKLEALIDQKYPPAVFRCETSPVERDLFSLPIRLGGLRVTNSTEISETSHSASRSAVNIIMEATSTKSEFEVNARISHVQQAQAVIMEARQSLFQQKIWSTP